MSDIPYRNGRGFTVTIKSVATQLFCAANCRVIELPDVESFKAEVQTQNGPEVFGDTTVTGAPVAPVTVPPAGDPALTKLGMIKFDYPFDSTVAVGSLVTGAEVTIVLSRTGTATKSAACHVVSDGGIKMDPASKDGMVCSCEVALHQMLVVGGTAGTPASPAPAYASARGWQFALAAGTTAGVTTHSPALTLGNWKQFTLPTVKGFNGEVQTGNGVQVFGDPSGTVTEYGEIPFELADDDSREGLLLTGEEVLLTLSRTGQNTLTVLGHVVKGGGAKADPASKDGMVRKYALACHGLMTSTAPGS